MLSLLAGIVVWVAVATAGFRQLLLLLAGAAIVGTVLILAWQQFEQAARTAAGQAAKLRIPRTNAELVDLRMGTDSSFGTLPGRVRNNDPRFTPAYVELRLREQDCPTLERCDIVGDTTESIFVKVPSQQAQEIHRYVSFDGIGSPRTKRTWTYDVVSTSGLTCPVKRLFLLVLISA